MEEVKYGRLTVFTSNIENLSQEALNSLECGDCVVKKTIEGGKELRHTYVVTHKQATGMCITYHDASCIETVSYDFNTETNKWEYNSTDVTPFGE